MPGIAGIVEKGFREDNPLALRTMVKSMLHEKFYTSGTYVDRRMGLQLGWVCHKDSFSDCLPVWNEKKDICLIFAGEDAADESEIAKLRALGHPGDSGNAGYLVHLYEEEGIAFLKKLNGWFSGVLVDLREEKAFLFNDRYGLHRLYYHENEAGLFFSSEAKALLKIMPELRRIDDTSLGEYFSYGCTFENRTLFSGISLVPPGSMWSFAPRQSVVQTTYFDKGAWENQPVLSETKYYERLKETFAHIIKRYYRPKERVAVSLTGGIDTRMIMAWASFPPFKVPCYTFGGMVRDSADVRIARRVAKMCQQQPRDDRREPQVLFGIPRLGEESRLLYGWGDGRLRIGRTLRQ